MWFAGMTVFRAVYVFDLENTITLHASSFLHMLPKASDVENGNDLVMEGGIPQKKCDEMQRV